MVNLYKSLKDDINVNPYKTTYGSLLKMNDVEPKIQHFVNKLSIMDYGNYKYDVNYYSIHPIIITGKTEEEKDLPPFLYPYGVQAHNGEICLVVDLRDYVRQNKLVEKTSMDSYEDLLSVAENQSAINCLLSIGKVMAAKYSGNDNFITFLWKPLARVYSSLFITLYNTRIAKLGALETPRVSSIAVAFYYLKSKQNTEMDFNKITNLLADVADRELVADVQNYLTTREINKMTGRVLTELTKEVVDQSKVGITIDTSLFNNAKGEWFGLKGSGLISMMMECDSLFLPIVYYALDDRSFNRSKVSMMLQNIRRDDKSAIIDGLKVNLKPANV